MTNFEKFINHKFELFDEEQFMIDATSNENDGEFFIDCENFVLTVSYDNDILKVREQDYYDVVIDEFQYYDNWEQRIYLVYKELI